MSHNLHAIFKRGGFRGRPPPETITVTRYGIPSGIPSFKTIHLLPLQRTRSSKYATVEQSLLVRRTTLRDKSMLCSHSTSLGLSSSLAKKIQICYCPVSASGQRTTLRDKSIICSHSTSLAIFSSLAKKLQICYCRVSTSGHKDDLKRQSNHIISNSTSLGGFSSWVKKLQI
jgi:hypothetical protein